MKLHTLSGARRKFALLIIPLVVIGVAFSYSSHQVQAYSLPGASWYSMTPFGGYSWVDGGNTCDIDNNCYWNGNYCAYTVFSAFGNFWSGSGSNGTVGPTQFYSNASCSTPSIVFDTSAKEVYCPAGQVMVGTRMYEFRPSVDDEHNDALCAPAPAGITLPSNNAGSHWVVTSNAHAYLANQYKFSTCNAGEVMTGIRMYQDVASDGSGWYGTTSYTHVDAYCTPGMNQGGVYSSFLEPMVDGNGASAYWSVVDKYKEIDCPQSGQVMTGVRWYVNPIHMDDEHTDALCYKPPVTPTVNVHF